MQFMGIFHDSTITFKRQLASNSHLISFVVVPLLFAGTLCTSFLKTITNRTKDAFPQVTKLNHVLCYYKFPKASCKINFNMNNFHLLS
jgi:hypothetical protein